MKRRNFWHMGAVARAARLAARTDEQDRIVYRVAGGRMLSFCTVDEWQAIRDGGVEYQQTVLALREPVPSL